MAQLLVADDDDLLGELLRFKLEDAGHQVAVVTDGEAALDSARSGAYDLMVLDAMMPILSGLEVLRALREGDGRGAALPVVMLTSRKAQEDVVTALQSGANDYLTKPFIPDELVVRVNAILKAGSGRDAS